MKTAVVLFNLGGPDSLESVRPFLFNLFYDKAIISLPNPFRYLLARFISWKRAPYARTIYAKMGGASPILEETRRQAAALQMALDKSYKVFICMRYFSPVTEETVAAVKAWYPDRVVLLPLYPHYSKTTTGSSCAQWIAESRRQRFECPPRLICCYPTEAEFIAAHAKQIRPVYEQAQQHGNPLLVFSAHGLPKSVIAQGDPYQWQMERTVEEVMRALALPSCDHILSYQSRVGPLAWLGPNTSDVVPQAARQKRPIVVVPIAFVSEHSETLVELDMDYRALAEREGCPGYFRVPALGAHPDFIAALKRACETGLPQAVCALAGNRICPADRTLCPCPA